MIERLANTPPIVTSNDDVVKDTGDEDHVTNDVEKCKHNVPYWFLFHINWNTSTCNSYRYYSYII